MVRSTAMTELAPSPTPARRHVPEFDVMRGVAITLVVYLHSYFSPWEVTPHREVFAMHAIHLFAHSAVPVFFFMSAFLLGREEPAPFASYVARRARRIAIPLAFWMVAAFAFLAWDAGGVDGTLVRSLALFDISGQFYFVVVLLVLTVVFYPMARWSEATLKVLAIGSFFVSLAMIAFYQWHGTNDGYYWSVLAYRNPLVWIFAFSFGFYIGRARGDMEWTLRYALPALAGMVLVSAVYFVLGERDSYPNSYFGVTVFLFACLSLVVYPAGVQLIRRWRPGRVALAPFRALAGYSFAMYLVFQPFFLGSGSVADRLVSDNTRVNQDFFKLMNVLFLVGFFSSLAFVILVGLVWPPFAREFLGIERGRRGRRRVMHTATAADATVSAPTGSPG
jgi:peptidoglycan/LPS O-acetylase OafA/YrhL